MTLGYAHRGNRQFPIGLDATDELPPILKLAPLEFNGMSLNEADVNDLVAFLMSLTEDYDDA